MTKHEIKMEVVEVKLQPERRLSAKWTVEAAPKHYTLSDEELQHEIEKLYDRWNFETGSDKDKELLEELEEERDDRHLQNTITAELAAEITKAIDKEILEKLTRLAEETNRLTK